jgi:hypothetical protein
MCGRDTEHDVVSEESQSSDSPSGEVSGVKRYALKCRGCRDFSIRTENWYHDGFPGEDGDGLSTTVSFQPPRLWRRPPEWLDELQDIDADLHSLLEEVYSAANDAQVRLLSMGTRTAVDHLMNVVLGGDYGAFEEKLSQMRTAGHITEAQKESLQIVIDAGSASSHRGYKPARQLIHAMLMTMEEGVRRNV